MSWIASTACSGPFSASANAVSGFAWAQEWIAYLLFAQCPQHIAASIVNVSFLLSAALAMAASRKHAPTLSIPQLCRSHKAIPFLSVCFAIVSSATLSFTVYRCVGGSNADYTPHELIFLSTETLAWFFSIVFLWLGAGAGAAHVKHPYVLRVWWFLVWMMCLLMSLTCIFVLEMSHFETVSVDDISVFAKLLISSYFLYKALYTHTGAHVEWQNEAASLKATLLKYENGYRTCSSGETRAFMANGFFTASFFSKLTFSWLSPLLASGSKRPLRTQDVPELAQEDMGQTMFALFQKHWPQDPKCRRPMTLTVLRAFWPQIIYTGFLHLVRSLAMFCGPLLIPSFTSYARGVYVTPYDGYALVALLLLSKIVEVIATHQANFLCYKLGNNIRTGISAILYHKALRLSSVSRQTHGVGSITNYLLVDAQQISDACLLLHLLWAVPLQVVIANVILYYVLGPASLGGLLVMVLVSFYTAYLTQIQRYYQDFLMNSRDERMKAIIQALAYIKVIKLQAWEEKFRERIEYLRQQEFAWLTKFVMAVSYNSLANWNTQSLISTMAYLVAILIGTQLTNSIVFTAASVFKIIQSPIRNLPLAFIGLSQILSSVKRIDKFMLATEIQESAVSKNPIANEYPVVVENGSFAWIEGDSKPTLERINMNIKKGSLVMIVGKVGSGKSSLLSALLGEMVKLTGKVSMNGSIAYVSQNAWIQNATVEENILFGASKEDCHYHHALKACALVQDLKALDHGDQTEIGEKGINLSGGQKQRIQLARAVYQNSDVYLLDDIFSAVDAHTGMHIFTECILGALQCKTILLVTHKVEFLAFADVVLVMNDGRIWQGGLHDKHGMDNMDFHDLMDASKTAIDSMNTKEPRQDARCEKTLSSNSNINELKLASFNGVSQQFSSNSSLDPDTSAGLIAAEQKETGKVSLKLYKEYVTKAYGFKGVILLLLGQIIWQALLLWSDFWISQEIPQYANQSYNSSKFIVVYIVLNGASWLAVVIRIMLVAIMGLKTAQMFFLLMLCKIFRAPMSFFDTTPSGRILSRFSSDQANLDFAVHFNVGGAIACWISTFSIVLVICISAWPIVIFLIPLAFLFKSYQDFYMASSREITRLDSITKGPLIYHLSEMVSGIETIRCFLKQKQFELQNFHLIDSNMKMDFCNGSANEWFGFRLDCINTAVLTATATLLVVLPESIINPDIVGLALSYALSLNSTLITAVVTSCTAENKMVSVERIYQFTEIESEAELCSKTDVLLQSWPSRGKIVSSRLKLRYRPGTPLVLKGVSFTIDGGHKVGIVGRTGSGKSTLLLAIFRLVEPVGGHVLIDDVDITLLGLQTLRSRLGIIPQEPVLFEGSIRLNVDPFNCHSDEQIWTVLQKCQLADVIGATAEKLEAPVAAYGGNWSVGQRQLLCFGRALLKHSKVLFLDEATASVDTHTDAVIQKLIRQELHACTIVSIVHRIPTVIDADRVLVMDAGRVKEYDAPLALLQDPNTFFARLLTEYQMQSVIRN